MKNRFQRVREKMKNLGIEGMLITNPFNIRYVSSFTGSSAYVLITLDSCFLLTDFRYMEQAAKQCSDFQIIDYLEEGLYPSINILAKQSNCKVLGFESSHVTFSVYAELKKMLKDISLLGTKNAIEEIRMVKDENEIQKIIEAADIAQTAYKKIIPEIREGICEQDLAVELEYQMKKQGAEDLSFPTIVVSGEKSSLPHGSPSDKKLEYGDLVTIDFGCIYKGYCSDMTRSFVIGKASSEQEKIYTTVLDAQNKALEYIQAGLTGQEVDHIARDHIEKMGYGKYFGHGLGHGVGLEVHEEPRLSKNGGGITLEPGMIVTVEPGIYIPQLGGVRIEDLVVVEENGCRNLIHLEKQFVEL